MHGKPTRRVSLAPVLFLIGSAALLSTLFQGWFITGYRDPYGVFGETFYPMWVQLWGSSPRGSYSDWVSYFSLNLNHTGVLYSAVTLLIIFGAAIGFEVAYQLRRGGEPSPKRVVSSLLILAVIVAAAGPVVVTIAQPSATCADWVFAGTPLVVPSNSTGTLPCGWDIYGPNGQGGYGAFSGSTAGPQSSFAGSENGTGYPHFWEPWVGWYLAWLSTAFLLLGALLYFREARQVVRGQGLRSGSQPSDPSSR
jgi:hypothetical protein